MGQIGDRIMCGGAKLPHDHCHEDSDCRADQGPRGDEPGGIGEREEEGALAAIELPPGIRDDVAGPPDMQMGLGRLGPLARWRRADEDCGIVEEPVRPSEFEKSLDEDHGEPDDLHLPQDAARRDRERQIAEHAQHIVSSAQQS